MPKTKLSTLQENIIGGTIATVGGGLLLLGLTRWTGGNGLLRLVREFLATPVTVPLWVLIGVMIGVLLVRAVMRRRLRFDDSATRLPVPPPAQLRASPQPPAAASRVMPKQRPIIDAEDDRIFVDKSPTELVQPFQTLTTYQADKIVQVFYGKWVRWEITINNVREHDQKAVVTSKGDVYVSVYFDQSETAKVIHLERGAVIQIEGQVTEVRIGDVTLRNCRLLPVRPRTARASAHK